MMRKLFISIFCLIAGYICVSEFDNADRNRPLHFHGRTVDEGGRPLPGVKVKLSVRHWYLHPILRRDAFFPAKMLTSDHNGYFHWKAPRSDSLSIESCEKDGYHLYPGTTISFGHEDIPTNGIPVEVQLWKNNLAQPLLMGTVETPLSPDGIIHRIEIPDKDQHDVAPTSRVPLQISLIAPAIVDLASNYNWSYELVVPGGGLVQETDSTSPMYLAPETGYTPTFRRAYNPTEKRWSSLDVPRFYVKGPKGAVYGRIEFSISPRSSEDDAPRARISYAINPSGSRYLIDPDAIY